MLLAEVLKQKTSFNQMHEFLYRKYGQQNIPILHIKNDSVLVVGSHKFDLWQLCSKLLNIETNELKHMVARSLHDSDDNPQKAYRKAVKEMCKAAFEKFAKDIPEGWATAYNINQSPNTTPYFVILISKDPLRKSRSVKKEWYHLTLKSNVESIMKTGLVPNSTTKWRTGGSYHNKLFLINPSVMEKQIERVKDLAIGLQSSEGDNVEDIEEVHDIAILKVKLPDSVVKRIDYAAKPWKAIYIQQPIPPEDITVVYTGDIEHMKV